MCLVSCKKGAGFTLIELLIVIAIVVILAGVVIVAVNPARQLAMANNSRRRAEINAILNAVSQNMVDNKGTWDCAAGPLPSSSPTEMKKGPAANLVLNESFEDGCVSDSWFNPTGYWECFGPPGGKTASFSRSPGNSGNLSQTIAIIAGSSYQVEFTVNTLIFNGPTSYFNVYLGGTRQAVTSAGSMSYPIIAGSSNTDIIFEADNGDGMTVEMDDVSVSLTESSAGYDICNCLVPKYIAGLPFDPSAGNYIGCASYNTGYTIFQDPVTERVTVSAPNAQSENGTPPDISVTR